MQRLKTFLPALVFIIIFFAGQDVSAELVEYDTGWISPSYLWGTNCPVADPSAYFYDDNLWASPEGFHADNTCISGFQDTTTQTLQAIPDNAIISYISMIGEWYFDPAPEYNYLGFLYMFDGCLPEYGYLCTRLEWAPPPTSGIEYKATPEYWQEPLTVSNLKSSNFRFGFYLSDGQDYSEERDFFMDYIKFKVYYTVESEPAGVFLGNLMTVAIDKSGELAIYTFMNYWSWIFMLMFLTAFIIWIGDRLKKKWFKQKKVGRFQ